MVSEELGGKLVIGGIILMIITVLFIGISVWMMQVTITVEDSTPTDEFSGEYTESSMLGPEDKDSILQMVHDAPHDQLAIIQYKYTQTPVEVDGTVYEFARSEASLNLGVTTISGTAQDGVALGLLVASITSIVVGAKASTKNDAEGSTAV
jgi:hypothetical protein